MDSYFSEDRIVYYLCRLRAKYAHQRNKKHSIHVLTNDIKFNHHTEMTEVEVFLKKILPPRRKWKKLNKKQRSKNDFQNINSIESNTKSILITIEYYKREKPNEEFLAKLNSFILSIQELLNDPDYQIQPPEIYPKIKDQKDGKVICRPISIFELRDKIIISLTNKYLTDIFDNQFYELSHAFRATRMRQNLEMRLLSHHDSIVEILNYKKKYKGKRLWVGESDMSKFYDSVNHSIIKNQFKKLVKRVEKRSKIIVDKRAIGIFYKYLDSYTFVKSVMPLNSDQNYWKSHNISKGKFEWVEKELIKYRHYRRISNAKIGIAQGGALSGLIANIVLDYADSKIEKKYDERMLYVRFCDDMIIIHPTKWICEDAILTYKDALLKLKLVPHEFQKNLVNSPASFWHKKTKSKFPYKWTSDYLNKSNMPWIGFVGYEIHFHGHLRIRKSSFKKELNKQKEVVFRIINAIENKKRARNGRIKESAYNRLIGMSVGRVQMWNYNNVEPDMCWLKGFHMLNRNQYLIRQLKQLDKGRNHQIALLKNELSKYVDPPKENVDNKNWPYYGKPFSYYYQTLKGK